MNHTQQQKQILVHPVDLGVAFHAIGALQQEESFQNPDDLVKVVSLILQASIAFDQRRIADHTTKQTLHSLSHLQEQERQAQEKAAAAEEDAKNSALQGAVDEGPKTPTPPIETVAGTTPIAIPPECQASPPPASRSAARVGKKRK